MDALKVLRKPEKETIVAEGGRGREREREGEREVCAWVCVGVCRSNTLCKLDNQESKYHNCHYLSQLQAYPNENVNQMTISTMDALRYAGVNNSFVAWNTFHNKINKQLNYFL